AHPDVAGSSGVRCRRAPAATLFPYTTLFRSRAARPSPRSPTPGSVRRQRAHPPEQARRKRARTGRRTRETRREQQKSWEEKPLRSEEHTSELQSRENLVCRLLLEKNKSEQVQ